MLARLRSFIRLFNCCLLLAIVAPAAGAQVAPTTVSLAASSTTVTASTEVTLTATVSSNAGGPVGQVNFCDATAAHCTDIHLVGTAQLTSRGTAQLLLRPGVGSHSYNAIFVGNKNYATSTSSNVSVTVPGSYPTSTTLVESGSVGDYSLTATVTGSGSNTVEPSGMVSFSDTTNGNYVLSTASLVTSTLTQSFVNYGNPGTNGQPSAVTVGDFNNDGIADLAVTNLNGAPDNVAVLLGTGDGAFSPATNFPVTGGGPVSIAVGDFNRDGIQDLATANENDATVTVLLGRGDGSFTATNPTSYRGSGTTSVAVGDFNNDGFQDLVVADFGGTVTVLQGDGQGNFTPMAPGTSTGAGTNPFSVAVGDFDGDGTLDVATANNHSNSVTVLRGVGDGTFTAMSGSPVAVGMSPRMITAADFNGDGIVDLATVNSGDSTVSVLLGKGSGNFTLTSNVAVEGTPESLAVGDFNGDGIPDLAVPGNTSNTVSVLLGRGDGTFSQAQSIPSTDFGPVGVAVGDFNGDGIPDFVTVNSGFSGGQAANDATVVLTDLTSTATATVTAISPVGTGPHNVTARYAGDTKYNPSVSSTSSLTGQAVGTTLTLRATPSSSTYGQQVVLLASLSPSTAQGHNATGTVSFYNGTALLGTGTVSGGLATLNVTSLPVGTNSLTASYGGDADFAASSSSVLSFPVTKAGSIVVLTSSAANTNASASTGVTFTATTHGHILGKY
jgi:Bacterial Ig-like domain (group 3)/FG-GAP-like repeat